MVTIYVERSGGAWEARFWQADEGRYFRVRDGEQSRAVRKCRAATGYDEKRTRVVKC